MRKNKENQMLKLILPLDFESKAKENRNEVMNMGKKEEAVSWRTWKQEIFLQSGRIDWTK